MISETGAAFRLRTVCHCRSGIGIGIGLRRFRSCSPPGKTPLAAETGSLFGSEGFMGIEVSSLPAHAKFFASSEIAGSGHRSAWQHMLKRHLPPGAEVRTYGSRQLLRYS